LTTLGLVGPPAGDAVPGFDPADARALAASLVPGTALAFLLVEHGWAQPLFDAIAETGGGLLGEGFLTAGAGLLVGAEVAAREEAVRGICGSAGRGGRGHAACPGGGKSGRRGGVSDLVIWRSSGRTP
jgi:hypothetical protein